MKKPIKVKQTGLLTSSGKRIRKVTKVIFPDGTSITMMEKMPKNKAIEEALRIKKLMMPELV